MKTGLIIAAGGSGSRMNSAIKKQYMKIGGVPILIRSVLPFIRLERFSQIVAVVPEQDFLQVRELFRMYDVLSVRLAEGGQNRQDSVYNGLLALADDTDLVLIHDGARPMVSEKVIERVLEGALSYGACCPAVPLKDTIKVASPEGWVKNTLDRNSLWAVQTPQAFDYRRILEAHKHASENGILTTDDCGLMEQCGHKIKIVEGDYANIKITTTEDILIAETLLELSKGRVEVDASRYGL
jgi:2-C-methyl-D-erythritol 4-phosphate cytidylyltransferase